MLRAQNLLRFRWLSPATLLFSTPARDAQVGVLFEGASGPQAYTATLAETITVSEAGAVRRATATGALPETLTLTENGVARYGARAALAEAPSLNEGMVAKRAAVALLGEAPSWTEAGGIRRATAVPLTEALAGYGDTLVARLRANALNSETFTVNETAATRACFVQPLGESLVLGETGIGRLQVHVALSDSFTAAEVLTAHESLQTLLGESWSSSELGNARLFARISGGETLPLSESGGSRATAHTTLLEAVTLSELASIGICSRATLLEALVLDEAGSARLHAHAPVVEPLSWLASVYVPGGSSGPVMLVETLLWDEAVVAGAQYHVVSLTALSWQEATNMASSSSVTPIYSTTRAARMLLFRLTADGPGAPVVQIPVATALRDFGILPGGLARVLVQAAREPETWQALNSDPRVQISFIPIPDTLCRLPSTSNAVVVKFHYDGVLGSTIRFDASMGAVDFGVRIIYAPTAGW